MKQIPNPVIAVASEVLAANYTHSNLNNLFMHCDIKGDIPNGNKIDKCITLFTRCNDDPTIDSFGVLGRALETLMEVDKDLYPEEQLASRDKINKVLAKYGLSYQPGGIILGSKSGIPSRTLKELLQQNDLPGLENEFVRALNSVEDDPAASLTAASAIIESLCKTYIEDEHLEMPADKSIKPLWKVVSKHIGFDPASIIDDDLKKILSGLTSIVDGLGSLRTHRGSAHGQGRNAYRIEPRHARLTIHAAYTACIFVIETWNKKSIQNN